MSAPVIRFAAALAARRVGSPDDGEDNDDVVVALFGARRDDADATCAAILICSDEAALSLAAGLGSVAQPPDATRLAKK